MNYKVILKRVFCSSCNRIFFKDCWKPAVEVLDLKWIDLFSTGVYVEEEDVPMIIEELLLVKEWAVKNLKDEQINKIVERIDGLREKLPLPFQRQDVIVFIG
ncbi:hypothetical protein AMS66_29060 [Paenibacillus xylanivorans]|uniref:Uncharacterized protein n=2 Tax=Paenibacillus xylanivorans TaxID=1705561 RepID=A0A0N0C2L3_9BACL|nr:hypothetical protein AMS66_29060 [Paenibacillus xylanivorans]